VRQVVLERAAVRLEGRVVDRVKVQIVVVRDDDAGVAEALARVHGTLDALGQADRLEAGSETARRCLEEALQEALHPRQDPHPADASTRVRTACRGVPMRP
jgi:hypothetical protein